MKELAKDEDGKQKLSKETERLNRRLAEELEKSDLEEKARNSMKPATPTSTSGDGEPER